MYFNNYNFLCYLTYYMVLTLNLAGKIWSSICIQDIILKVALHNCKGKGKQLSKNEKQILYKRRCAL